MPTQDIREDDYEANISEHMCVELNFRIKYFKTPQQVKILEQLQTRELSSILYCIVGTIVTS